MGKSQYKKKPHIGEMWGIDKVEGVRREMSSSGRHPLASNPQGDRTEDWGIPRRSPREGVGCLHT